MSGMRRLGVYGRLGTSTVDWAAGSCLVTGKEGATILERAFPSPDVHPSCLPLSKPISVQQAGPSESYRGYLVRADLWVILTINNTLKTF